MKKFITKISSILLSLSVLLASTGITLHKHICNVTGEKQTSLIINKSNTCCLKTNHHSKEKDCKIHQHKKSKQETCNHSKEKDCCDYEISYLKADFDTNIKQDFKFSFLQVFLPNSTFSFFREDLQTNTDKSFLAYSGTSPPISGRKLLILKQSFLL